MIRTICLAVSLALTVLCFACRAEDTSKDAGGTVELPGLTVDIKNRTVTGTGRICLTSGILEYLVVAGEGKTYESVLEMDVNPSDLHAALLMIGAVPGAIEEEFTGDRKGDPADVEKKGKASRFGMSVQWTRNGKTVEMPAEELLYNRKKDSAGHDFIWVFTGSYFYRDKNGNEHYSADEGKSIAGIWYDGSALFNLAEKSKNPYRGGSFGFEVNTRKVPPKDTVVEIVFQMK